jgi:hypothetical protein
MSAAREVKARSARRRANAEEADTRRDAILGAPEEAEA